ncbi:MAG: hypothetical protein HKN36_00215 [Hellea sp.]|nr:hypothetical protein [Hellea sp.]
MHPAYISIPAQRDIPLLIFGDHASHRIPDEYDNLGLSGDDLTRHIAWDIGTDVVVKTLCKEFGCAGQLANISRLLIDINRDHRYPCLIPVESDGTLIPGNRALDQSQKDDRIAKYHTPYHEALDTELDKMGRGLAISVHSFTPKMDMGDNRELEFGLLVKHDELSADMFMEALAEMEPGWRVMVNEPYSAHVLNYTVDTSIASRELPHLAIEINQAMIDTDDKAKKIAQRMAKALTPVVNYYAAEHKEQAYAS